MPECIRGTQFIENLLKTKTSEYKNADLLKAVFDQNMPFTDLQLVMEKKKQKKKDLKSKNDGHARIYVR